MRFALVLALSACTSIDNMPRQWAGVSDITGPLAPELGPALAPPAVAPTTLRIASWNVEKGADPEALAHEILTSPALASGKLTPNLCFCMPVEI